MPTIAHKLVLTHRPEGFGGADMDSACSGEHTAHPNDQLLSREHFMTLHRCIFAIALCVHLSDAASAENARVCVVTSMTGSGNLIGKSAKAALDLFEKELGAASTSQSRKIETRLFDTGSDPRNARLLSMRAVREERCLAIVGALLAAEARAFASVADEGKIPYIETVGRWERQGDERFVFRASSSFQSEWRAAAIYLRAKVDTKKFIVLADELTKAAYDTVKTVVQREIEGSSVVALDVSSTQSTFEREVGQFASDRSAFMLVNLGNQNLATFAKDLSKQPDEVRRRVLLLNFAGSPSEALRLRGSYPIDVLAVAPDNPSADNGCKGDACDAALSAHREFVTRLSVTAPWKVYSDYPAHAAQVFSGLQVVAQAIRKAARLTGDDLRAAMETGRFETPLGPVEFDKQGRQAPTVHFIGRMLAERDAGSVRMEPSSLLVRLPN